MKRSIVVGVLLLAAGPAGGCRGSGPVSALPVAGVVACPSVAIGLAASDGIIEGRTTITAGPSTPDLTHPLRYAWTASGGSFLDASQSPTTYLCPPLGPDGPQTISVTATRGPCTVAQQIVVICFTPPPDGGAGGEPGGNEGSGGSSGGPPVTDAAPTASPDGGGGETGSPADGPDDGGMPTCGDDDATADEGDACNACTLANCSTLESSADRSQVTDGCRHLASESDRILCQRLYCCMRARRCVVGGDPTACWCGDVDSASCTSGSEPPRGPCLAEFQAAARTTDATQIALHTVDPTLALGGAVNLATCRSNYCSDPPTPACASLSP